MSNHTYILRGIGGSHAHGLSHEGSDLDYRGVFSYPTKDFFTLAEPNETFVTTGEEFDTSAHELKKFLRLASKGNPDVLELLGLKKYTEWDDEWGNRLRNLTPALLSTEGIHAAYGGYARQQFSALKKRAAEGNESFSAGMGSRTWKHAKHLFRLLEVGQRILETGRISVLVQDPDWYLTEIPKMSLADIDREANACLKNFDSATSVLPDRPDLDRINAYLIDYRKAH